MFINLYNRIEIMNDIHSFIYHTNKRFNQQQQQQQQQQQNIR